MLLTASEKPNFAGSGICLYVGYQLGEVTIAGDRRYELILSLLSQKSTPSQNFLRQISRLFFSPFQRPTYPSVSTLTRRMSPACNCLRLTTNPIYHRPRCRRTIRIKRGRRLRAWLSAISGISKADEDNDKDKAEDRGERPATHTTSTSRDKQNTTRRETGKVGEVRPEHMA